MAELEHPDPSHLRISDEDRHKVADILRDAAGEGRLDLEELDERLDAVYKAKTYGDLVPLTADLPAQPHQGASGGVVPAASREVATPNTTHESSFALLSGVQRRGNWRVPEQHTAFSLLGSVELDLREATFTARETTINASAIMGDVTIKVDAQTQVVVDGVPIMGDFTQGKDKTPAQIGPNSPIVRVKGLALMGSVSVTRLPPPGTPKKILGTY